MNDETIWIIDAQKGDDNAYAALVEAWQKPVYNFCYRMLGESEEAEDAAQETFLRAYQHLERYDIQRPFGTWLLSIAAHHCIDRLRRMRRISFSLDANEAIETWFPDGHAANPEEEAFGRVEGERLDSLVQTLEPAPRAALVMRYWQGATEQEIARALHLSLPAVKSRLHRARQSLAKRLLAQQEGLPMAGKALREI